MADFKCECSSYYDLTDKLPKLPRCGHTVCFECISRCISINTIYQCTTCNEEDRRDLEKIPDDLKLIERLNFFSLFCYIHNKLTLGYNSELKQAICSECGQTNQAPLPTLELGISKQLLIDFYKNKKFLSKEIRKIIVRKIGLKLDERVKCMNLIKGLVSESPNCLIHPNQKAVKIDLNNYSIYCDRCDRSKTWPIYIENPLNTILTRLNFVITNVTKNVDYIYSEVIRYINNPTEKVWKPAIVLIEMEKNSLIDLQHVACGACGKFFGLGEHMPVSLPCRHLMCFTCCYSEPLCKICHTSNAYPFELKIIDYFYILPECIYCSNGMDYTKLPFHNFCECVICSSCIRSYNYCNVCNFNKAIVSDNFVTLHNQNVKKTFYLYTACICERCNSQQAVYCDLKTFIALCIDCGQNNPDIIALENYYELDQSLLSYWYRLLKIDPQKYRFYPSLPIQSKRNIITKLMCNQNNFLISSGVKILKLFKKIFPVTKKDKRVFPIDGNWMNLTFRTDKSIYLQGIILAGRVDEEKVEVDIYDQFLNSETIESTVLTAKENFIYLQNTYLGDFFSIAVRYKTQCQVFSGKFANNTTITQNGIKFAISDLNFKGYEKKGPILGILYIYDYNLGVFSY